MDQVTQANSAQTEELSSTAASLSDQSQGLMDLVKTFTLSRSGRAEGKRGLAHPVRGLGEAAPRRSFAPRAAAVIRKAAAPAGKMQPALAAVHTSDASDASFEEF
jgi:hypothetical protein